MKNLYESILSGMDNTLNTGSKEFIKEFLKYNYGNLSYFQISNKPNSKGLYEVSYIGKNALMIRNNHRITSLTNGMFVFSKINTGIHIFNCKNLTSIEGLPKVLDDDVYLIINYCNKLNSLKGCPEKIGGSFEIFSCPINTLKYGPSYVGDSCSIQSTNITSLEDSPKYVKNMFNCSNNEHLISIKGCPKEVGIFVYSETNNDNIKKYFNDNEILQQCNVRTKQINNNKY